MSLMTAVRFNALGSPADLNVEQIPAPSPGPGEVLVEVHAAAINPSDVKIIGGAFGATAPQTPGRDFAGVVIGGDAPVGTEVWGSGTGFGFRRAGAHAQYVVLPAAWISTKPERLTMAEAAAVGAPYVAAWSALIDSGAVQAGETLLITGALGAVGRAATQIARWKKLRVIGAVITDGTGDADAYINVNQADLAAEVRRLTDGRGADVVLDAVGGSMFEPSLRSLGLDGRQLVITSVGSARVEFDLTEFYHNRQRLIGVDTAKLSGEQIASILDALKPGFDDGALAKPQVRTWPLASAPDAYAAVAQGSAAKQVLLPF